MFDWMAWTWPTAFFFIFVFGCIGIMAILEVIYPGGHPRHGILGIDTTRGDRLFIWLLGSAFIFLAWLGFYGLPLWGCLAIQIGWGIFVFWKV